MKKSISWNSHYSAFPEPEQFFFLVSLSKMLAIIWYCTWYSNQLTFTTFFNQNLLTISGKYLTTRSQNEKKKKAALFIV